MASQERVELNDLTEQEKSKLVLPDGYPLVFDDMDKGALKRVLEEVTKLQPAAYLNATSRIKDYRRLKGIKLEGRELLAFLWSLFEDPYERIRQYRFADKMKPVPSFINVLLRYGSNETVPPTYDEQVMHQAFPEIVDMPIILSTMPPEILKNIMYAPVIFDKLKNYSKSSPKEKERLEIGVFGVASMFLSRIIVDVAIARVPELEGRFSTMAWPQGEYVPSDSTFFDAGLAHNSPYGSLTESIQKLAKQLKYHAGDVPACVEAVKVAASSIEEDEGSLFDYYKKEISDWIASSVYMVERFNQALSSINLQEIVLQGSDDWTKAIEALNAIQQASELLAYTQVSDFPEKLNNYASTIVKGVNTVFSLADDLKAFSADPIANGQKISKSVTQMETARQDILTSLPEVIEMPVVPRSVLDAIADGEKRAEDTTKGNEKTNDAEAQIAQRDTRIEELTDQLIESETKLEHVNGTLKEKEEELHRQKTIVESLSKAKGIGSASTAGAEIPMEGFLSLIHGSNITPRQVLQVAGMLFSDSLVILDSAYDSADDSVGFEHGVRLLKTIATIATDYRDMLIEGRPDSEARHLLGNGYAAKESETVRNSEDLARLRTFQYKGESLYMPRHFGIGRKDSTVTTIRMYFHWDAEDQQIVIGYCGPHLPTTSHYK